MLDSHLRENLLRRLRDGRAKHWLQRWTSLAEQGGLAHSFSKTPDFNYWLRDCKYLRYREYRFTVKARLNQLPVASQKLKLGKPVHEAYCRGCGSCIETQEHCLSVCNRNMPAMKERHDKIISRLVKAIPDRLSTKYLDQCAPGCEGLKGLTLSFYLQILKHQKRPTWLMLRYLVRLEIISRPRVTARGKGTLPSGQSWRREAMRLCSMVSLLEPWELGFRKTTMFSSNWG